MKTVHDLEGKNVNEFLITKRIYLTNFSAVYTAKDTSLGNRLVAIKFAKPDINLPRFVNDAIFLGELSTNPHIVPIFNVTPKHVNKLGTTDYVYYVMKYVPNNLEKELKQKKTLPLPQVWEILKGVCDALDFAHNHPKKIIHRDIKPSNILLGPNNYVYLCDFGLARFQETTSTMTVGLLGTPGYLSPEQAEGVELDIRSDIYSLGSVLFEMLGGRIPFDRRSRESMMVAILTEPPPRLDTVNKSISIEVANVVEKCLKKNREERYNNVRELLEAFRKAMVDSGHVEQEKESISTILPKREPYSRRRFKRLALIIAPIAALVVLCNFFLLKPIEVAVEASKAKGITVIADNLIWKNSLNCRGGKSIAKLSKVLVGKRKLVLNAEGYETKAVTVPVSLSKPNLYSFKMDPALIPVKFVTMPSGSFYPNSFKTLDAIDESIHTIEYSEGDTIKAELTVGSYEFRLNHNNYENARIELNVNNRNIEVRKKTKTEPGSWKELSLLEPVFLTLNPELGYLNVKINHLRVIDGRREVGRLENYSDCYVDITPESGLSKDEESYLRNEFFVDQDISEKLIIPTAIRSLTFSMEGMESVRKEISISPGEDKSLTLYFENKKEYGSVSFNANLPCGKDKQGITVRIKSSKPASHGTFRDPLGSDTKTPVKSLELETGKYTAAFSILGWYGENSFEVKADQPTSVECSLSEISADVQIFLSGLSCNAVFNRLGPLCPATLPGTISIPFTTSRKLQKGNWRIDLLDEKGNIFKSRNVRISQPGIINVPINDD